VKQQTRPNKRWKWLLLCLGVAFETAGISVSAHGSPLPPVSPDPTLQQYVAETMTPWYYLAAIRQYETHLFERKKKPAACSPNPEWSGLFNPDGCDTNPSTIALFGGRGQDGNGDGVADPRDGADRFASVVRQLGTYHDEDELRRKLWDHYQDMMVVDRITGFAKIFKEAGTVNVTGSVFPIPRGYNYTYRDTWGDKRGWGGRRIHVGTDIFAGYGTPVRSTTHGVVEVKGWNKFGGWRVGIRDLNNVYHYYAHLSGFSKKINVGDCVKPGEIIGYVGSSGYGKKGTSGKFPPHLHYGMYKDTGNADWPFDPYPHLRKWERQEAARKR
jgi:murein DD-endopeptidase MepM/ murein hydrolase activator NlpD